MLHRPTIIFAMLLLFAGANSLSAVCATKVSQSVKNPPEAEDMRSPAEARGGKPSEQSTKRTHSDGQTEDSEDGKADLGHPPSPVLERQVRAAPFHLIDHRPIALASGIAASPQSAKPRYASTIPTINLKSQACVAGFPRSTNGPPTQ